MNSLPPHAQARAESNARDYRINLGIAEIGRGATGADLKRRGYSNDEIDEMMERFVGQQPEAGG